MARIYFRRKTLQLFIDILTDLFHIKSWWKFLSAQATCVDEGYVVWLNKNKIKGNERKASFRKHLIECKPIESN